MEQEIVEQIKNHNLIFKLDEPLSKYTTLKIGGPARYLVFVRNINELIKILQIAKWYNQKILIIGAGSNLLISDEGFDGIVIKLKNELCKIDLKSQELIAYGGAMLPMVIKTAVDAGLSGLEELFGIPGTVGGAVIMNAGTKIACISDNLEYIEVIKTDEPEDGLIRLNKNEINFDYRTSGLEENYVIVKVVFRLKSSNSEMLKARINEVLLERIKTQPLGTFNAGCIFKNPKHSFFTSAKLIEECGLKGYRVGDAYVSDKHANFIINRQNATAKDFVEIMTHIIKVVKEKFNVELEPEIKLIGLKLDI
ncbi:MAG: UDP-N-acetylmuramate dehydrogenase [Endomicrobia bacterium]|nr:UDP-N-acetylmuramate dehydrogenase [Endomicrobiia bacterium]MDW8055400.1 UDP-N-acetylmuramate dehydrogenase [Elusimicrobiota bacterium]